MRMCAALSLITLSIAGCGESQHSRFYVLTESPVSAPRPGPARSSTTVAVGEVKLPPELDRPQMARRTMSDEISYAEFERWAGPLDQMVRRVLIADLDGRLPSGTALIESDTANTAGLAVSVDIIRFDADATGRVQLNARWELLGRSGHLAGAPRNASIVQPGSGADAAAIAASMSRAVADLAGEIATSIGGAAARIRS